MARAISRWQEPPQHLCLTSGQLHLWRFPLNVSNPTAQQLETLLSQDESARAARLLDRQKAAAFVVARGRLRQILGRYLNLPPVELAFSYASEGKPALHRSHCTDIAFNLSHSGDLALLAVTAGTAVGVDLEQIDPRLDFQRIAGQFFNLAEVSRLNKFPVWRQRRGFYRLWTAKEAGLKKSGCGFSAPGRAETERLADQCLLFPIAQNYLGAVVSCAQLISVQRYQLS